MACFCQVNITQQNVFIYIIIFHNTLCSFIYIYIQGLMQDFFLGGGGGGGNIFVVKGHYEHKHMHTPV